jgi:DNA invertase Pin-like site-specific DNA recombinase
VQFGRKPKLSPEQINHAREQIEGGKGVQEVADLLNVGRVTLWRNLKEA